MKFNEYLKENEALISDIRKKVKAVYGEDITYTISGVKIYNDELEFSFNIGYEGSEIFVDARPKIPGEFKKESRRFKTVEEALKWIETFEPSEDYDRGFGPDIAELANYLMRKFSYNTSNAKAYVQEYITKNQLSLEDKQTVLKVQWPEYLAMQEEN